MAAPAIEAIVFDCFGVLYTDAKRLFYEGLSPEKVTELRDIFHQIDHGFLDKDDAVQAVMAMTDRTPEDFEALIRGGYRINDELVREIGTLKRSYKIGLLSNIGRGWINDFFNQHQLSELFDAVVLSGEEGIAKPHPRIYEVTCERLGVEPEACVMIDDIRDNCAGADAVGMKSIHYLSNTQCLTELKAYTG